MSEIAKIEVPQQALATAPEIDQNTADFLQVEMKAYQAAAYMAEGLAASSLVPDVYRNQPANVALVIMQGAALGLKPLQALNGIYVLHGKPALESKTMAAVLLQHGYKIETVESSPETVTVRFTAPDGATHEETKTIKWAKGMGLDKNMWVKDPEHMLYQRCIAYGARKVAPNLLLGMPYSVDELQDKQAIQRPATPPAPPAPAPQAQPAQAGESDQLKAHLQAVEQFTDPAELQAFMQNAYEQSGLSDGEIATLRQKALTKYTQLGGKQ